MEPFLQISTLATGYGKKQVLYDVSLGVSGGEAVAIIGPNGAGKSTLLKAIAGVIKPWSGSILLDDEEVGPLGPRAMLKRGVVYIPQGRVVFEELTVAENLRLAGRGLDRSVLGKRTAAVFETFPELRDKYDGPASDLSGGMKQMLAISRALIQKPRVLLLDEPSLGLSPDYVARIFGIIRDLAHNDDIAVLVVEQKAREVGFYVDRAVALKLGKLHYEGPPEIVNDSEKMADIFL